MSSSVNDSLKFEVDAGDQSKDTDTAASPVVVNRPTRHSVESNITEEDTEGMILSDGFMIAVYYTD